MRSQPPAAKTRALRVVDDELICAFTAIEAAPMRQLLARSLVAGLVLISVCSCADEDDAEVEDYDTVVGIDHATTHSCVAITARPSLAWQPAALQSAPAPVCRAQGHGCCAA